LWHHSAAEEAVLLVQESRVRERVDAPAGTSESARIVLGAGALLVLCQLAFRAWVVYPSWFFLDDYNLLHDATRRPLTLDYLLTPYNSHLMPGGRLIVWLVADSGPVNWAFAATLTLALQAAASVAALWMLTTLFGPRWPTLALLAIYLTSAITVPATIWWAAALNLVPLQVAFFLSVGTWVRFLRGRRTPWLVGTVAMLAIGLLFDVKALLIAPVLAFLALAYFAHGSLRDRIVTVARRDWPVLLLGTLVLGGYVAYYLTHVDQPLTQTRLSVVTDIANTMLGTAFMSAVVGGPWRWTVLAPPTAYADPPAWALHLAWVAVVLVVLYAVLRRRRTLRAWALLAGYLLGLMALLVESRAPSFGGVIGLEYRYLTDSACVVTLCLGLAFLPLGGSVESSAARTEPLLRVAVPEAGLAALLVFVCGSGVVSSVRYAGYWHSDNASDPYLHNLAADLKAQGAVDLADQPVAEDVMSNLAAPNNTVRRLTSVLSDRVAFPRASARLAVVAPDGTLQRALIGPGVVSRPGPRQDCGWLVGEQGRNIPLTGRAFPWVWWLRVGYLASQDSAVRVSAGSDHVDASVQAGLNSLYVRLDGTFDTVRIDGLDDDATLCVDTIEVGQPTPGGRLP
jgi:hypothetical protein